MKARLLSSSADMKFGQRLKLATDSVGVEWGPTPLGRALGVSKQTAERWMGDGQPASDTLFAIVDKLKELNVKPHLRDPRWLATGLESAPADTGLDPQVDQLVRQYLRADPRWQLSIRLLSGLAVEDQIVAAADVNIVVARILGMKPKDLRYPSDAEVAQKLGLPPGKRRTVKR